jgi:hypothetical protein
MRPAAAVLAPRRPNPDNGKDPCVVADDPNITFLISATEVGERITQANSGAWILAPVYIREALLGGCRGVMEVDHDGQKNYIIPPNPKEFWFPPDRLRWVNALNLSMRREDFPDRPWPWVLCAYLSPNEHWEIRDVEGRPLAQEVITMLRVFLYRSDAVQWGLWPALESQRAGTGEESPSPDQQLNDPAADIQTSAPAEARSETPPATQPNERAVADPKRMAPASASAATEDQAKAEAAATETVKSTPEEQAGPTHDLLLVAAIKERLSGGRQPGKTEPWGTFCREIRRACKVDEKNPPRGYSDRTIRRTVLELDNLDKLDKLDI